MTHRLFGSDKRGGFICLYTWHIACLGLTREVVSSAFTHDTYLVFWVWQEKERCFYLPLHMTHSLFGSDKRGGFICLYTWHISCLGMTREVVSSAFTHDTSLVWVWQEKERWFHLPLHMTQLVWVWQEKERWFHLPLHMIHSLFESDKRGGFICLDNDNDNENLAECCKYIILN